MAYTTIKKPQDYFNTVLYTGTGSSQAITGVDFQPDMVWIKDRTGTGYHRINDAVRGATKEIYPNVTNAENTEPQAVTSFDTDGFTVGSNNGYSQNGYNFASWNWKANGAGSANTAGSINSTVSVNTTSGFSIVSYTGNGTANSTVGHGLGATPKFIIIKPRSASGYWCVTNPRFVSVSDPNIMYLQLIGVESDDTNINGTTAPSSTVFGVGDYGAVNTNGQTQIAYCFTPIQGYSAMGTYVGNGNADGTFVYTGFKPAFIISKGAGNISSWSMTDTKRSTFNDGSLEFFKANTADAESSRSNYDILSNGFKMRTTDGDYNGSGNNYIYMAFAEQPLVGDNPATAR